MVIFGITGAIGNGKSTFGDFLTSGSDSYVHWEASDLVIEVANDLRQASPTHPPDNDTAAISPWLAPLSDIVAQRLHVTASDDQLSISPSRLKASCQSFTKLFEYLSDMQQKPTDQMVSINRTNKSDFRPLLQWLGGYLILVLGNVWFDEIVRRLHASHGIELAVIGGLRYPADAASLAAAGAVILEVQRPGLAAADATDLTERERQDIPIDTRVINDSGLAEFKRCAQQVIADESAGRLRAQYKASSFSSEHA